MGQRRTADSRRLFQLILACLMTAAVAAGGSFGCERAPTAAPASSSATDAADAAPGAPSPVTAASLVPAATDLILGMGAGDRLVAVSNWDPARPETDDLPRVGDYRSTDWEKLIELRPDVMVVQFAEEKMPPGMRERADELGIELVNVRLNRLDDVFTTLDQLCGALGAPSQADEAADRLRARLDAVRARVAGREPVRTLVTTGGTLGAAGGGTFVDDVLSVAGGRNVLETGDNAYPMLDREQLLALNPDAVIALMPGASEQAVAEAERFWQDVPQVSAVRDDRVYILTEPYTLLPGYSLGQVAELFAERLHPDAPTTAPAGDGVATATTAQPAQPPAADKDTP